jgi:hypothetical protein
MGCGGAVWWCVGEREGMSVCEDHDSDTAGGQRGKQTKSPPLRRVDRLGFVIMEVLKNLGTFSPSQCEEKERERERGG